MKLNLKNWLVLLSLLMIVLQSTSQVKYIISEDSIICYTKIENRQIARVFLEGERDKILLDNCEDRVALLLSKDSTRVLQIAELTKQVEILDRSYLNTFEIATNATDENVKLNRRVNLAKWITLGLSLLLIIK